MTVSGNELPGMGAAVEVAAYRVCVEALTNIVRHAHAPTTELTLTSTADSLTIEVVDDGKTTGIWPPGTGITSMRERAALVGGTLSAADRRVLANLPL